ncbi:MAG: hypothetical protein ABSF66_08340 [Terriglobales bacterium]
MTLLEVAMAPPEQRPPAARSLSGPMERRSGVSSFVILDKAQA